MYSSMLLGLRLSEHCLRIAGRRLVWGLVFGCVAATLSAHAANRPPAFYQCDGELEASIWKQWDGAGKEYLRSQLIAKRLVAQGDAYALYDIEIIFHNLLAMAQRCQRGDRQVELAEAVKLTYAQLEQAPGKAAGKAWVCKGGAVCNATNKLVNTEVMLTSVQFLAFATSVANGLARAKPSAPNEAFANETVQIALQHLQRWNTPVARLSLKRRVAASQGDVKDGSSALFLVDKDLWQTSIYADLAGMLGSRPALGKALGFDGEPGQDAREHVALLLKLFKSRTTLVTAIDADKKPFVVADLDRGFWRLYADNRYAGYSGAEKPVSCVAAPNDPKGQKKIQVKVPASSL